MCVSSRFEKMAESCKKNLEILKLAQSRGLPLPKHHFEEKSFHTVRWACSQNVTSRTYLRFLHHTYTANQKFAVSGNKKLTPHMIVTYKINCVDIGLQCLHCISGQFDVIKFIFFQKQGPSEIQTFERFFSNNSSLVCDFGVILAGSLPQD